jgi:3',5'-cyclic AMP phosphodiesterase CpdA
MIAKYGYAWWGWWAKPQEQIPRVVFAHFADLIKGTTPQSLIVYLADSGQSLLWKATITKVEIPAGSDPIDSPESGKTPMYYIARTCKAWFKLTSINPCELSELSALSYEEVPGFIDDPNSKAFDNKRIFSMEEMLGRLHRTIYFVQPFDSAHHTQHEVKLAVSPRQPAVFSRDPRFRPSNYIIHFSDLHFGKSDFPQGDGPLKKSLTSLLGADLTALGKGRPAAVVVSGDLTWKGNPSEFQEALTFVTMLRSVYDLDPFLDVLVIPGNHDITWADQEGEDYDPTSKVHYSGSEAERNYQDFFTRTIGILPNKYLSMGRRYLLQNFVTVDLLGLNSCRVENQAFSGYGYVGLDQLTDGASSMGWSKETSRVTYRMAFLHHHLIPVNPVEESAKNHDYSLTLDAGQLLYKIGELGVDCVGHGHQHQPFLSSISKPVRKDTVYQFTRPTLIHGSGSIGVTREKLGTIGKNAYSIYDFDPDGITLTVRATSDDFKGFEQWSKARLAKTKDFGLVPSDARS